MVSDGLSTQRKEKHNIYKHHIRNNNNRIERIILVLGHTLDCLDKKVHPFTRVQDPILC